MQRQQPEVTLEATEDGDTLIHVPDKRTARLIQLGLAAEREEARRRARRRVAKQSRKRNR